MSQESQPQGHNVKIHLPRQRMPARSPQTHQCGADHAIKHPLKMRVAESDGVEMALEKLQHPIMRGEDALGTLLFSDKGIFVRWKQFDIGKEGVRMTVSVSMNP